jgi:hypothetical protein
VGVDPFLEGYSGFENTDLERELKQEGINRLFVGGLATDYCVKYTVLEALDKLTRIIEEKFIKLLKQKDAKEVDAVFTLLDSHGFDAIG